MPNWCNNVLSVHGPTESVKKFIEENKHNVSQDDGKTYEIPLSFGVALPTPDQTQFDGMENRDVFGEPNYWYNWNVANWGTKWDLDEDTDLVSTDNENGTSTAVYQFDTAWAPPEMWLHHVVSMYPDLSLRLEFREDGMGFAGVIGFHRGRCVEMKEFNHIGSIEDYEDIYG